MSKQLDFTYIDPRLLRKNAWNPNQLTAEATEKLKRSIELNGHIRPILVRELDDNALEIVGGEHRCDLSIELGHDEVPILNLGKINDAEAKRILLLDNSRYGEDEVGKLSLLLEDIGTPEELAQYMTYSEEDLASLMHSDVEMTIEDLDELDELDFINEEDDIPAPAGKTHQTMKFKVDIENAEAVSDAINRIKREQGFEDSDAQVSAGDALMWLVRDYIETPDPEDTLDSDIDELLLEGFDNE